MQSEMEEDKESHFNLYSRSWEYFLSITDLLGGEDKQVQGIGVYCFMAVKQPCHLDTC